MPAAFHPAIMIADLQSARFASIETAAAPASKEGQASRSGGDGLWNGSQAPAAPGESEGFRPMTWLLPWLWQLSQRPVEEGEAIEWDVDLPDGDRMCIHALPYRGDWIIDFSGSSRRLQRWIGQHAEDLVNRLSRVIGKPVRLHLDPKTTSVAS